MPYLRCTSWDSAMCPRSAHFKATCRHRLFLLASSSASCNCRDYDKGEQEIPSLLGTMTGLALLAQTAYLRLKHPHAERMCGVLGEYKRQRIAPDSVHAYSCGRIVISWMCTQVQLKSYKLKCILQSWPFFSLAKPLCRLDHPFQPS